MKLSDLPRDLLEEILSKLPGTSLRAMRLTCKNLNTSFEEKHINNEEKARESMAMMMMDDKVYLMDINPHGINNISDLSIKRKGKLISLDGLDHVADISHIFHCDGLVLCVTRDKNKRLVVWNPYSAETTWIKPISFSNFVWEDNYAIGYEKKKRSFIYKILRFIEYRYKNYMCEIYDLKTKSWRVLNITLPEGFLYKHNVSLKGNTYWIGRVEDLFLYLICFDFTNERFGPRLHLPIQNTVGVTLALSSVREQLVVLIQQWPTLEMEIWVTSNIVPETVSWSKLFLAVDMRSLTHRFQVSVGRNGFFIDEEKKIAVFMDKNKDYTRHIAIIFGENGYIKQVDLGEVLGKSCDSSYVRISRNLKRKHIMFD